MNLSEEQILELGQYCEDTLRNPVFNFLTQLYYTKHTKDLLESPVKDSAFREASYHSVRGAREFCEMLADIAKLRADILNPPEAPSDDDFED